MSASAPVSVEAVLAKFPQLLTPAERQLPSDQRTEILRKRVTAMLQDQQQKRNQSVMEAAKNQVQAAQAAKNQNQMNAAAAIAAAAAAGGQIRPPPNAGTPGANQSPRVGMQQVQMNGQQVQMAQNVSFFCYVMWLTTRPWRSSCDYSKLSSNNTRSNNSNSSSSRLSSNSKPSSSSFKPCSRISSECSSNSSSSRARLPIRQHRRLGPVHQ